jgi:hypothetical protein
MKNYKILVQINEILVQINEILVQINVFLLSMSTSFKLFYNLFKY